MKRALFSCAPSLLAAFFLLSFGCTSTVKPSFSQSEFLTNTPKKTANVALLVTQELRDYVGRSDDPADLKTWEFELGPAVVDAFNFSLQSRVSDVNVALAQPGIVAPVPGTYTIVPTITSFEATEPLIFKFEEYHVYLSVKVEVFDRAGEMTLTKTYTAHGTKQGSIGYEAGGQSAHPVAAEQAIREIVKNATEDIIAKL